VAAVIGSLSHAASKPALPAARRALSLHARQLLAASLALAAFLGLTGIALDQAFRDTAVSNLEERLQNHAYAYLGQFEFTRNGELIEPPNTQAPDSRFLQPGSGLYAIARGRNFRWSSPSALGRDLPEPELLKQNEKRFEGKPLRIVDTDGISRDVYRFSNGLAWEQGETGQESTVTRFTIAVYEDAEQLERQVGVFRRSLWGWLGLAAVLLLLVQMAVLRWSLQPLRKLETELSRVRRGVAERLSGEHPTELQQITDSINGLIESEHGHLAQSRNTLSDLAHSLKTPLAVLRSRLDSGAPEEQLRREVAAQVQRMSEIVSYQLSRAARSGHALFSAPIAIEPRAEEIVASLEKVYLNKGVICEFEVDAEASFYGELGDLQELLGNLLENAFKWGKQRVLLTVRVEPAIGNRRPGVFLAVEDDGPGVAAENVEKVIQRGVRGDERVHGHGIGLAIVQDIARAYRGELKVERSQELGGARFVVHFPPVF
jgi:two-component system sensor histidine kinase PhoQ